MNLKLALVMGIMGLTVSAYAQPQADTAIPQPNGPNDMHTPHDHPPGPGPKDGPGHRDHDAMMKDHPLTDAQIVQIVETTNDGEIAAARQEKNHGKSDDAKSFASDMIDQHTHTKQQRSKSIG